MTEAATFVVLLEIDAAELANGHRNVPGHLLADDLLLFYHAYGFSLYLLELELDLRLDDGLFDHPDLLHSFLYRPHLSLLNPRHLPHNTNLRPLDHLLNQLYPSLLLLFFPHHSLLHLNSLHLVSYLSFCLCLLFQNKPLNHLFLRSKHLLTPFYCLHQPFSPGTVPLSVFPMHVAVFMAMYFHFAGAGPGRTAGLLSNFAPISAVILVVAAAAAASGLAGFVTLACLFLIDLTTFTEGNHEFIVGG